MKIVTTPINIVKNPPLASTFGADVWVIGSPVATDSAPGATFGSVPANRLTRAASKDGSLIVSGSSIVLRVYSIGGTSITFTPWYWDDNYPGGGKWVIFGVAGASVTSGSNPGLVNALPLAGAYMYVQIVSQTGGVTAVGYHAG